MEREQAGFGIVQRVENVVHEAGAKTAEGGHFFSLDELGLGLLDFAVGHFQRSILIGKFGVGGFKVAFVFVQFVTQSKLAKTLAGVDNTATDNDRSGEQ